MKMRGEYDYRRDKIYQNKKKNDTNAADSDVWCTTEEEESQLLKIIFLAKRGGVILIHKNPLRIYSKNHPKEAKQEMK